MEEVDGLRGSRVYIYQDYGYLKNRGGGQVTYLKCMKYISGCLAKGKLIGRGNDRRFIVTANHNHIPSLRKLDNLRLYSKLKMRSSDAIEFPLRLRAIFDEEKNSGRYPNANWNYDRVQFMMKQARTSARARERRRERARVILLEIDDDDEELPDVQLGPVRAGPQVPVEPPVRAGPQVPVEPPVRAGPQVPVEPPVPAEPQVPAEPAVPPEQQRVLGLDELPDLVEPAPAPAPEVPQQERETFLGICAICQTNEVGWLIVPCGHLAFCQECADRIWYSPQGCCPFCRAPVDIFLQARLV